MFYFIFLFYSHIFRLPPHLQCFVPASAYSKLNESESVVVLGNLKQSCTNVDSEVSTIRIYLHFFYILTLDLCFEHMEMKCYSMSHYFHVITIH